MTSSGALMTSPGIPIGPPGNPFTVFQVGYWKIQLLQLKKRKNHKRKKLMLESDIKIHSTVFMDISIDGVDAAVKDGAAIVEKLNYGYFWSTELVLRVRIHKSKGSILNRWKKQFLQLFVLQFYSNGFLSCAFSYFTNASLQA